MTTDIFVFEFATAGGYGAPANLRGLADELRCEGGAMHDALVRDLRDAGYGITSSRDAHFDQPSFARAVREARYVILIAPEIGGILLHLARQVESLGGDLLSADSEFIAIASDKHETACRLQTHGVRVPRGALVPAGARCALDAPLPWVRKPLDGAGSMCVERIESAAAPVAFASRVEAFCPGIAASVAACCGPSSPLSPSGPLGPLILEPCAQHLSNGSFQYLGGYLPLDETLAVLARRLAAEALQALPKTRGYVGIDLVLGQDPQGQQDYVIEINPRLTTSYVGLRAAAQVSMADCIVRTALGQACEVHFSQRHISFSADGRITGEQKPKA